MAGKAKRFNVYDSSVAEQRKIVQGFGQQRQNLAGIGSGFRSPPLSPPIATNTDVTTATSGLSEPLLQTVTAVSPQTEPTTTDIDCSIGNVYTITLDRAVTMEFTNETASKYQLIHIIFTQDATGSRVVTWPASLTATPTVNQTTLARTDIVLYTIDQGTTWNYIVGSAGSTSGVTALSGLTIDTDFDANGVYKFVLDGDADTYLIADTDDRIEFFTGNTEKLRLDTELQLQGGVKLDLNGNDLVFGTGTGEYMNHGASSNIRVYIASSHKASFNATGLLLEAGYRLTVEDQARFSPITKPGTTTSGMIYTENLTNDELVLNAPTSGKVRMDVAGTEIISFGSAETEIDSTSGYNLNFVRNDLTPTDDDSMGVINFQGNDSGLGAHVFAKIEASQSDVTAGTEDGNLELSVIRDGNTSDSKMVLGPNDVTLKSGVSMDYIVYREESTPATGVIGTLSFKTDDSDSNITSFGIIEVDADVITNGAEDSRFTMKAIDSGTTVSFLEYDNGALTLLDSTTQQLGFYGSAGSNKQTVSGSRGGNVALQGLLTALANLGIITDSTT